MGENQAYCHKIQSRDVCRLLSVNWDNDNESDNESMASVSERMRIFEVVLYTGESKDG